MSEEVWPIGMDGKPLEKISLDEAMSLLVPGETVYVYVRVRFWMAGERSRNEVLRVMQSSPHVWKAGPGFAAQGQGLIVWNGKTWWALETIASKGESDAAQVLDLVESAV